MKVSKIEMLAALYASADAAGKAAADACVPVPMIVREHANPFDNRSPVVKQYAPVMGGVCGFASIGIKPANSAFAKYLVAEKIGRKDSYAGGIRIPVFAYGQSMAKKEAYAYAFAEVLRAAGIRAYGESRMD